MRVMNFLPSDYTERRGRRRANVVCMVLAGAGLLALGTLVALSMMGAMGVASLRRVVEQQYEAAGQQIEQLKALESRKEGLVRKVEVSADLLERVPRSHVLARLTNALPAETSIQVLVMSTVEVEVPLSEVKASGGGARQAPADSGKGSSKKKRVETVRRQEVQFRLSGLAKTDVQVAEYITRLTSDPLFEEVNLRFSEEFPYEEGVVMRRFELAFRLSLEAAKVLSSADALMPLVPASTADGPPPHPDGTRSES
ncbi:MAG: PilN domain-containing protein [Phycisphaerae bacterium]|nr:PilN domain-containing protein [Phycisphaerae bacterium]